MSTTETTYPEHDKLTALGERRHTVQEFIDWLFDEKRWDLQEYVSTHDPKKPFSRESDGEYRTIRLSREQVMAAFFDIDLNKISDEKQQMLDEIRAVNAERSKVVDNN